MAQTSSNPILPSDSLVLPSGTRLFHVGPTKTGSTSIQHAARELRSTLYEYGTYYPKSGLHHQKYCSPLLKACDSSGRSIIKDDRNRSSLNASHRDKLISTWRDFVKDLNAHPDHRILISSETVAQATEAAARSFVQDLGQKPVQIVITLRSLATLLPSRWAESVKQLEYTSLEEWLQYYYGDDSKSLFPDNFRREFDQGELVKKWARVAGPENVTVIVLDPLNKHQLPNTFEKMLGLPPNLLADVEANNVHSNRTLSLIETEIFRRVNQFRLSDTFPTRFHKNILLNGAIQRVQRERDIDSDEPRVRMPSWAAKRAIEAGECYANQISQTDVGIIGDLENLYTPSPSVAEDQRPHTAEDYERVIEAASEAIYGAFSKAAKLANVKTNE